MKIICPTCEASYTVPDAVVAAMRPVQCARCKNEWVPGAEPEEEAPAPVDDAGEAPAAPPAMVTPEPEPEPEPAAELEPEPETAPPVAAPPTAPLAPEILEAAAPVAPVVAPPDPPPVVAPAPVAARPVMPQPAAPRPDAALRAAAPTTPVQPVLAWVASIVLILAFIGAGIAFRTGVMKAWPPSTRLYAALGLLK